MLPYEILLGLRGTMCTCARGFASKQNSLKRLNSQVQNLYKLSNVTTKSTILEVKCSNVYISSIRKFHTNIVVGCQTSPKDSKTLDPNVQLINEDCFNDVINMTLKKDKSNKDLKNKDANKNTIEIPEPIKNWLFTETNIVPNKEIEKMFEEPKMRLHNYFVVVENETKIKNCLSTSFKHAHLKKKIGLSFSYHIKWPEEKTFTAVANSKAAAASSAALKCFYWLHLNKKITQNRLPVIYEKQEKLSLLKAPEELVIEENIINKINGFVDKFAQEIQEAFNNNTNEQSVEDNDLVMPDKQHPVSYIKVDPDQRNTLLEERMKVRPNITNTDLPIFQYKSEILKELDKNQSLVIKGDTGCGKTTQVPQFIIDHLTAKGEASDCSMVVTQPRRISAISLAERIAHERGEQVGDVIGYQVRLQQRLPKQNGGVLFCTTGILLRKMQNNPNLHGCSHVIVDEAHERNVDTDMLLVLLRRALRNNPSLKVIIMSATINADLFSDYFNCKSVEVPGRLFPVRMNLLDDMFDQKIPFSQALDVLGDGNNEAAVNCEQVIDLVRWIDHNKPPGAILCFLPGWGHIQRVQLGLSQYDFNKFDVIPLHSKIPYMNQSKIFQPPQEGMRKIILATDVAETGITVPDVVYVVDTACHKEVRYHENKGLSSIDTHWISKANLNQRKGRAGRVQEGESYHFITKKQYEELDAYPIPEVLRVNLEKTVLDCKTYSKEKAESFLGSMPQPPRKSAVNKAVWDLQTLGALDNEENLTALGKRIALFSIHPKLSKALVYSSIFQCLSPVATVAAALSMDSEIFFGTLDNKQRIRQTKSRFHPSSDHLAISWLYSQWKSYLERGQQAAFVFCKKNKLHADRMYILDKVREMNLEHLREAHMIDNTIEASDLNSIQNQFAVHDELVRGILLAGMDQILKHRNFEFRKGRLSTSGSSLVTEDDANAQLSPECVNHKRKDWPSPYLIYYQKTHHQERRTTLIRESSMISPVTVLLFSQGTVTGTKYTDERTNEEKILLKIDGKQNVQLKCDRKTAEAILHFRDLMWLVIRYFVENDQQKFSMVEEEDSRMLFDHYKMEMLKILGVLLRSAAGPIDSMDMDLLSNENDI